MSGLGFVAVIGLSAVLWDRPSFILVVDPYARALRIVAFAMCLPGALLGLLEMRGRPGRATAALGICLGGAGAAVSYVALARHAAHWACGYPSF